MSNRHYGTPLGLLAVAVGSVVALAARFGWPTAGVDDADIFLVYAKNFSAGHGFVYNVGGERVEGFTSLLWVLICSAVSWVTSKPEPILLGLSAGMLAASAWIGITLIHRQFAQHNRRASMALELGFVATLLATPTYLLWMTLPLMDAGLWALLLMACTRATILFVEKPSARSKSTLSLVFVAAVLTRPEAMAWVPIFLGLAVLSSIPARGFLAAVRSITVPAIASLAAVAGLTAFRILYFGYPFPNTYYAKVSPSLAYNVEVGASYLRGYLDSSAVVAMAAVMVALGAALSAVKLFLERSDRPDLSSVTTLVVCCAALAGLGLPLLTGGDNFNSFRFYQPVFPLLVLGMMFVVVHGVFVVLKASTTSGWPLGWAIFVAVALPSAALSTNAVGWRDIGLPGRSLQHEFHGAMVGRLRGLSMTGLFSDFPVYPRVGVITAGGFKLGYPGEVIDLMGLNNTRMGHSAGDRKGTKNHAAFNRNVFFELKPDLVVSDCQRPLIGFTDLAQSLKFNRSYPCAVVRRPGSNLSAEAFWEKGFLNRLREDSRFSVTLQ
jgi:arabinofuranosyltransferase